MRILWRALAALAAVLALALVALVVLAPRLLERPELRERVAAAAREATGRELRYERLDLGFLPPRLEVEGVALEGGPREAPLRAERVALEVALLPLLARSVVVDTLVVRGVELEVARTKQGIELPIRPPPEAPGSKPEVGAKGDAERVAEDAGVSVAVRELRIERSSVALVDRTLRPAVTWKLDEIEARAEGRLAPGTPIDFELDARLGGAPLHVEGEAALEGALDAKLALADFALAKLQPYLPPELRLAGTADLEVAAKGELDRFAGPLALDLGEAEITQGESFRKPAGERAALSGRVVREGEAFRLEDAKLRLGDEELALRVESAPRLRARLDAERVTLAGLARFLPGLGEAGAEGAVALDGLDVATEPLEVRGGVVLDGVSAPVGATRGRLSGRLDGEGDALAGEKLELRIGEQLFALGLRIEALAREPRARLRLASGEGADAGQLVAALSGKPGTLEGPLSLRGVVNAPLADPDALLRALSGDLQLGVTPGRLRGVSLLRSAFDALGSAGGLAAQLAGAKQRERLARFEQDAFETLAGSFHVAEGFARTEDLHLVYPGYRVDLRGALGLLDRSLDFRGKLTLFEELDRALADGEAAPGAAPARGVKRELPLAAVKGTLDAPRVVIEPRVALQFAALYYAGGERREKLEKKLDERLGEGGGKQVIDLLDSVLGGGRPAERQEEAP
jgi:hypothetical protein